MDYSNLFVCLMGMGTVFIGLICIIILVSVMSSIVRKTDSAMTKKSAGQENAGTALPAASETRHDPAPVQNGEITPQLIAAVSAVIAEEMGTDIQAVRIVSMKAV